MSSNTSHRIGSCWQSVDPVSLQVPQRSTLQHSGCQPTFCRSSGRGFRRSRRCDRTGTRTISTRWSTTRIDADWNIWFGQQRYAAVVLYHPEFENATTAGFFQQAAKGKTIIYRVGDWTKNFDAKAFDGKRKWHGVFQVLSGPVPAVLLVFTHDWLRLRVPQPLEP